ncbi:ROK family protein [Luteolibacter sp. SL250]|uniref:ROK family protein n=1 Tax=Luteolibacter sp. SL250 TaxID=2995170 RepID=UPI0022701FCD|nr:ROK family protein [Luteolibacter sp. SL250]WAC18183.1 ROK family protein [Luteolibacter sp. SL250]
MSDPTSHFVGLDIGGTTVKSVIVDSQGEQVGPYVEVRSLVKEGYESTFGQLDKALDELAANAGISRDKIRGIGLDVPAPSSDGVIWGRANLGEDWVGTDIRGKLSERTGIPVFMTNDGNAAALGEYALRNKHLGSLLLVAPGTGLGGGFVLPGGRGFEGMNGLALEVGHISVPFREDDGELPKCSCGLKGCAEAWVSLVALRRRVGIELAKPENAGHPLNEGNPPIEEKAFRLRDFAAQGDALAISIFKQQGFILGYAIADLVRTFDPGLVVIGGGLAESSFRDDYMGWIKEGFKDRAWPVYCHSPLDPEKETTRFEWAIGGDGAAAIGMAYTARELFQ